MFNLLRNYKSNEGSSKRVLVVVVTKKMRLPEAPPPPPRHKVPSSADKTFPCPSRELHSRPSVAPLSRREQITSADYTRLG